METIEPWQPPLREAGFSARLVAREETRVGRGLLRMLTGGAFAYAFGLATSVACFAPRRFGDALGVATTPLAFGLFYAPSLWVLLTLFDRPIALGDVARAAMRGVSTTGMALIGLVPTTIFFELTAGGASGRAFAALLELAALGFAGLLGLRTFARDVLAAIDPQRSDLLALGLVASTCCLGVLLGARILPEAILALHGGFR